MATPEFTKVGGKHAFNTHVYTNTTYYFGSGLSTPLYHFHAYSAAGGAKVFAEAGGTGVGDYAGLEVQGNTVAGNYGYAAVRHYGSGVTSAAFGLTLANYTLFYTDGASSNGMIIGTYTAKPLYIGTNNTVAITIDSSQNVNIPKIATTGTIVSTLATGTAPFTIASTTKVTNLNCDLLDGSDWANPAAIGSTTPAAGTFTTITANTSLGVTGTSTLNGLVDISGASGGQIKFPAAQNASADANTLDDYEEFLFTPIMYGSTVAGTNTYTLQYGKATKIGRVVFVEMKITLSAKDAAMAGTIRLTYTGAPALPSSAAGSYGSLSVIAYDNLNLTAGYTQAGIIVDANAATFVLVESGDDVAAGSITAAQINATTSLVISGFYMV